MPAFEEPLGQEHLGLNCGRFGALLPKAGKRGKAASGHMLNAAAHPPRENMSLRPQLCSEAASTFYDRRGGDGKAWGLRHQSSRLWRWPLPVLWPWERPLTTPSCVERDIAYLTTSSEGETRQIILLFSLERGCRWISLLLEVLSSKVSEWAILNLEVERESVPKAKLTLLTGQCCLGRTVSKINTKVPTTCSPCSFPEHAGSRGAGLRWGTLLWH